jgi:hypothetical protein
MAPPCVRFTVSGLRLVSEANAHEHHWYRKRRAELQHAKTAPEMRAALAKERARLAVETNDRLPNNVGAWLSGALLVTITRIAPSRIRDSDNLTGCAKHVRDCIAKVLGVDDSTDRIVWRVEQRRGGVREYGVEVTISTREMCPHCGGVMAA